MFTPNFEKSLQQFILSNKQYSAKAPEATIKKLSAAKGMVAKPMAGAGGEIKKYYTFNQTGNIMISSTSPDETQIGKDVKQVFKKAIVFFGAITAALASKEKSLYDYDALESIIENSGLFVSMHEEDRTFNYASASLSVDAAIIGSVLGAVAAPESGALVIAQQVLSNMSGRIQASIKASKTSDKIAHLLFVCENLMGMPIINASIFYIDLTQGKIATKSNCHESTTETINFKYHQHGYMFVDPDYINKFSGDFKDNPEFQKLIQKLAGYIKEPEPA